jgi:hypothetical protein
VFNFLTKREGYKSKVKINSGSSEMLVVMSAKDVIPEEENFLNCCISFRFKCLRSRILSDDNRI